MLICKSQNLEGKNIKKSLKIAGILIVGIVVVFTAIYFVLQSRVVQTALISGITKNISEKTNSTISIGHVNVAFFRKIILDDVFMSDQNKDSLFHSEKMVAKIDSLNLFKKQVYFQAIHFTNPSIAIVKNDSVGYNFDFLTNFLSSQEPSSKKGWGIYCSRFELSQGEFFYSDSSLKNEYADLLKMHHLNMILDKTKYTDNNNLKFDLEQLSMTSENGIRIENFSAGIQYSDSILSLSKLNGKSEYSEVIVDTLALNFQEYFSTKNPLDIAFNIDLKRLEFGLKDVSFLLDNSFTKGITSKLSGKLSGDFRNVRGKSIQLSVENFTHLNGDFYLNGINDLNTAYLFLNLNESYANLNEIRNLDLPFDINETIDRLPVFFDNVGSFSYKGNFTGFIDDFVAYGTAYSNLGTISSDVSFRPSKNEKLIVEGHISTEDLDIGTIFNSEILDKLSLNGEINGVLDYHSNYDLKFDGFVNAIDVNNYTLRKIDMNGTLKNKQFNGDFTVADPNLKMDYSGRLDLLSELPVFEFVANVDYVNLQNLKLVDDYGASLKLKIDANFEGSNVDNVEGKLTLSDVQYKNYSDQFIIDQIELTNTSNGDITAFVLRSDVLDAELYGEYSLVNIVPSFFAFYQHYLPSSFSWDSNYKIESNELDYHFHVKDIYPVTKIFKPELFVEPDFEISGSFKPMEGKIKLEANLPFIRSYRREFENIRLDIISDTAQIQARIKCDKINLGNKLEMYNVTLNSDARNDSLGVNLFWNNYGQLTNSGIVKTVTTFQETESIYPHIKTKIEQSNIYFSDSLWTLDETIVTIDSTAIEFNALNFHRKDQRFLIDGKVAENDVDEVFAKIENVELLLFEPLMGRSYFSGKINGEARLIDFYEKMMLNLDLNVNDFLFNDGYLGEFNILSHWDNKADVLQSKISLKNDTVPVFAAEGSIDPLNKAIDMNLVFDNSPISILQVIMPSTFDKQNGLVKGEVRLHGKFNHLMHDGHVKPITTAGMGLSYLNTVYSFSDPVWFSSDSIIFKQIKFNDRDGNTGYLNGSISHETFRNMNYNLNVQTDRLLAMNTSAIHNDEFYGTAYASGDMDIVGQGITILLSGEARSERGTNLYIPFESSENAEQFDFIEFITNKAEKQVELEYDVVTSGLDMNFDLEITPDAKVQIIFNSQIGDIIKGSGHGDLQVRVDRNYNISMYGNFVIDEGDYLFTLQNVINKRFSIDQGGTIEWVGDPYNALIDINAIYRVKTSLSDLFVGSYQDIDLSRRIPVDCKIHLSEYLLKPKIDFSIELPTVEERVKDDVSQLIVTQEDVNKQIISLLMLGRFYTPEFFSGKPTTETGVELVGATASELLSNQLSNWFSQITDVLDVGINWRPGNEISNDQVELALSTQILNDRVMLDGNIANNTNPNSNNNGEFVGDFDLKIKMTDNGKLQFKAYNHSNDNIIYDTAPYTQGIGFSYREEFNSINELLRRFREAIFRKEKKQKMKSE